MIHNFIKTFILTHVALADVFCSVLKTDSLFPSSIFATAFSNVFFSLCIFAKIFLRNSFYKEDPLEVFYHSGMQSLHKHHWCRKTLIHFL